MKGGITMAANYERLFKGIVAGAAALGTVVGTNMIGKLFKVDRLDREVGTMVNNNFGGAKGEPFEAEFVDDDFVSDQEVENRI